MGSGKIGIAFYAGVNGFVAAEELGQNQNQTHIDADGLLPIYELKLTSVPSLG